MKMPAKLRLRIVALELLNCNSKVQPFGKNVDFEVVLRSYFLFLTASLELSESFFEFIQTEDRFAV